VKEHVVSLQAALELYDLEQPASCCDLLFTHERSTAYCGLLAAGADDGSLVVWAFGSLSTTQLTAAVLFSRKIQTGKERGVLCVKFLTSKRLLVSTKDGGLLCLDMKGVVMCAIIPTACVLAMEVTCRLDTLVVVAGCSDGGIRLFLSDDGNGAGETLREIVQATGGRQQPSSGVSKLAIAPAGDIVVAASLDGCVRPWKMEYNF